MNVNISSHVIEEIIEWNIIKPDVSHEDVNNMLFELTTSGITHGKQLLVKIEFNGVMFWTLSIIIDNFTKAPELYFTDILFGTNTDNALPLLQGRIAAYALINEELSND